MTTSRTLTALCLGVAAITVGGLDLAAQPAVPPGPSQPVEPVMTGVPVAGEAASPAEERYWAELVLIDVASYAIAIYAVTDPTMAGRPASSWRSAGSAPPWGRPSCTSRTASRSTD